MADGLIITLALCTMHGGQESRKEMVIIKQVGYTWLEEQEEVTEAIRNFWNPSSVIYILQIQYGCMCYILRSFYIIL